MILNLDFNRTFPDNIDSGDYILFHNRLVTVYEVIKPLNQSLIKTDRDEHYVIRFHSGKFNQKDDPIISEFWIYPGFRVSHAKSIDSNEM